MDWEKINEAIENVHVVMFLITKEYQNSKSCRQEVMNWLGIRIVDPQYDRFGKRSFGNTITIILNLIVDDDSQQRKQDEPKRIRTSVTP
ncbi:unnamed protein product [Rotaria sp. Silwood1]|nr:unnamed protein product [Rotaria sp. Silwood1]